jgi:hypothetical protein
MLTLEMLRFSIGWMRLTGESTRTLLISPASPLMPCSSSLRLW